MSGLDETLRQRLADQPASLPPTTDSSTEPEGGAIAAPLPVNAERVRADYDIYVQNWGAIRADLPLGIRTTRAILAACRLADAVPALLDELTALRTQVAQRAGSAVPDA